MTDSSKYAIATTDTNVPVERRVIHLDGSQGEGGGQILRNAIVYASLFDIELHIDRIRARRTKPGLRPQHLTGLRLVSDLAEGRLRGDEIHSQSIVYMPPRSPNATEQNNNNKEERTIVADTQTAGSICLLLQAALPVALLACRQPCRLILRGGTNAILAPQYDYWSHVLMPTLRDHLGPVLAANDVVRASVVRRGYFPKGGGEIQLHTQPHPHKNRTTIPPIRMVERGEVCDLYVRSFVAGTLPLRVAEVMARTAQEALRPLLPPTVTPRVEVVKEPRAVGSGSGILLVARTTTGCRLAGSALGDRKKGDHQVGMEAATELRLALENGGCVDDWLQDQLILFMALADGTSELLTGSLTLHTQTAIAVAEQLCGATFQVTRLDHHGDDHEARGNTAGYGEDGRLPGRHLIRCTGVSFAPR